MSLEKNIKEIKAFLLDRYKDNLAAILIFGSVNTGEFKDGKSDIDTIILLKKQNNLNLEKEKKSLFRKAKPMNWSIIHFETLESYKKHIYQKGSWSSWITIINGSKKYYQTKEFEKFRRELIKKPISKKKLKEYLKNKDKIELDGYFKDIKNYPLAKSLMSHLRRKLQIINYFKTKKIIFDYNACVKNVDLKNKEKLRSLYKIYEKRGKLSKKEIDYYYQLAGDLTEKIIQS